MVKEKKRPIKYRLKESRWFIPALFILSVILVLGSLGAGYYRLSLKEIISVLGGGDELAKSIIINIRLPRVLAAYTVGAALSVSGAAYQGVFKNPLVSPSILGVTYGAGVGASIAIVMGLSYFYIQTFAFIAGIAAVFLAYVLSINVKFGRKVSMILAGTLVGSLAYSIISVIKYFADTNSELPEITYWLMGSLSKANMRALSFALPAMVVGFVILMLMRNRLNVLTLSDEEAQSLGVSPRANMFYVVLASTLLCSGAACLSGTIRWFGLMVPHISRGIIGSEYKRLLPVSAMIGGCLLLLIDDIARSSLMIDIPIGLLISFIGAPFFYLLIRKGGLK